MFLEKFRQGVNLDCPFRLFSNASQSPLTHWLHSIQPFYEEDSLLDVLSQHKEVQQLGDTGARVRLSFRAASVRSICSPLLMAS